MKINAETSRWARRYQAALRQHLKRGPGASLRPARELGRAAVTRGFETLDMARIHRQALAAVVLPGGSAGTRQRRIKRAKKFFIETITPLEKTHLTTRKADIHVNQLIRTLRRRTAESSASARFLKRSILLRQGAEQALTKSEQRNAGILAELHRLQKHLRDLKHTCLSTQENERQKMSLRLHDEIAQALIAIDLRLLTLKKAAKDSTANIKKEIATTQQLVQDSVKRISLFAHEFGI